MTNKDKKAIADADVVQAINQRNEPSVEDGESNAPKTAIEPTDKPTPIKEINGPKGLEPTRYGDWESKGRCYDF